MNKLKATIAAATLATAGTFATASSAQQLEIGDGLDAESYAILEQCIEDNPQGPQECIKTEFTKILDAQMPNHLAEVRAMGMPEEIIDVIECVSAEVPEIMSEHYAVNMKMYENNGDFTALLSGDQAGYDAFKAFMAATLNVANDCAAQYPQSGMPVQDEAEMLESFDFFREMMLESN